MSRAATNNSLNTFPTLLISPIRIFRVIKYPYLAKLLTYTIRCVYQVIDKGDSLSSLCGLLRAVHSFLRHVVTGNPIRISIHCHKKFSKLLETL